MSLSRLYLRLALAALVIGPIAWLLFTEDGRRRTDLVVLHLAGQPSVELNLAGLDGRWREDQILAALEGPEWRCREGGDGLEDRLCLAEIGGFNGLPSRYLTLFFDRGRLKALKLGYRPRYDEWLRAWLGRHFGAPSGSADSPALAWDTGHGSALLSRRPSDLDAALFWVAR